tara:strand:+ start:975 stop:1766 length:792 start_codon:yes stop_codon:yes gene_type:complete
MIGLFFGDTTFPKLILKKIKKKKINYFIIDLSKKNIFKKELFSYRVSIGQFGKILKLIRRKKCKKVIFAGKINKPKFSNLKLDIVGIYYIPRIIKAAKKGDAAIFKELIKILSIEKIKLISSLFFNPELSLLKGNYTKLKPNRNDLLDIYKGINELKKSNEYDHVQAIVVKNNKVIAKESSTGTKKMLQKISKTNIQNGTFIKFPKKKQDLRVDLPTVGFDTLLDCKKAGLKGVVLKSKQNIFLDKKKCIDFANKNKMFLLVK